MLLFPAQSDPSIKPFHKDLINFHSSCDVTKLIMTSVGKDTTGTDAMFRKKVQFHISVVSFFLSRLSKNFANFQGLIPCSL